MIRHRQIAATERNQRLMTDSAPIEKFQALDKLGTSIKKKLADLLDRLQRAIDPSEISRLGDELGRMVFGS